MLSVLTMMMETVVVGVATILLTIAFEFLYEWFATKLANRDTTEPAENMEQSMSDGCRTSLRMLGFGALSGVVVWGIILLLGS